MITNIAQFVKACGGRTPTAEQFGVVDHAVSNWQKRGHFPGWAVPRAMAIAMANKWAIAPELITASKPTKKRKHVLAKTKRHGRLQAAE